MFSTPRWWPGPAATSTPKQSPSRKLSQDLPASESDQRAGWEVLTAESPQRDDHSDYVNVEANRAGSLPVDGSSYTTYSLSRSGVEELRAVQKRYRVGVTGKQRNEREDSLIDANANATKSTERSSARMKREMEAMASEVDRLKESLAVQQSLYSSSQSSAEKAQKELRECRTALLKYKQEGRDKEEIQESTKINIAGLQHELTRTQDQLKESKFREDDCAKRLEELRGQGRSEAREKDDVINTLTKERDELKVQIRHRDQETKTLLDQINESRLKAESNLEVATYSLKERDQRLVDRERRVEGLKRELQSTKGEARRAEEKSIALENNLQALHAQMAQLQEKFDRQATDFKTFKHEAAHTKKQYTQLVTLLEDRTSELKGAQTFLSTADSSSGAEIINTLQKLNGEILQNCACMADSMVEVFKFSSKDTRVDEQSAESKRVATMTGGVLSHFLATKKHSEDPILIQISFQACLALYLRWTIMAWIVGEPAYDRFLDGVYAKVREAEPQAVSGRWRALTRTHLQQLQQDEPKVLETLSSLIIDGLVDIIVVAGCTALVSDIQGKLKGVFSEKVNAMVGMALRINRAIGEDITSGNMEVVAVNTGVPFDATTMDNAYEDGEPTSKLNRVLCPTDLGLQRLSKNAVTDSGEDQWDTKILLKPKVATESIVDSLEDL